MFALYRRINDALALIVTIWSSAIVAFFVLALFGGALTRYLTGTGYAWVLELPPELMPWLVFPMAGVLLRSDRHIAVDVAPALLSGTRLAALRLVIMLISLVGCAIFVNAGYEAVDYFHASGQVTTTEVRIPVWWLHLAFPVGFALAANFCLEGSLRALFALRGVEGGAGKQGGPDHEPREG